MVRAFLIAVLLVATGCSSTELISSWKHPQLGSYQRILAIGISQNSATRRIFEDSLVQHAAAAGFEAIPSYRFLPEGGKLRKERIAQAVKKSGADGVLIMRLVAVDRQIVSSPGYWYPIAGPAYGYYDYAWYGAYDPPRIYEEVSVILQTSIYDAKTGELAWTAKTRTVDTRDLDQELHEVTEVLTKDMKAQGIVGGVARASTASAP